MLTTDHPRNTINQIKTNLVNTSLVVGSIAGTPLIIFSLLRAMQFGQIELAVFNVLVYLLFLGVTFFKQSISYNLKAIMVISLLVVVGITDFYKIGLVSFGYAWFIAASILGFVYRKSYTMA